MPEQEAAALLARAIASESRGQLAEARAACRRIVAAWPGHAQALHLLTVLAYRAGDLADAADWARRAAAADPSSAHFRFTCGRVAQDLGRDREALEAYTAALQRDPAHVGAWLNSGVIAHASGDADTAAACFRRALELEPDNALAHNNLGEILRGKADIAAARAHVERAADLAPDYAPAQHNLGNIRLAEQRLDEATACFRRAAELDPGTGQYADAYLMSLLCADTVAAEDVVAAHRRWGRGLEQALAAGRQPHDNIPDPARRLRIGYVSPDFRRHPVAQFLGPVLARHDPGTCEVHCYHTGSADETTPHLRDLATHWTDAAALSLPDFVAKIRADRIDILVDLAGHTTGNRLDLFACKPAPVQMTWLGYLGTTGLTTIDYRLGDSWMDPPGMAEALNTEGLLRLPHSQWCYTPDPQAPDPGPLPALANGHVTFGCFNNLIKLAPGVVALWAELLARLPGARLVLAPVEYAASRAALAEAFARHGIAADRLTLLPRLPAADYLAALGRIDIALDPFPFNGGTTSFDTLWMGAPLVTLAGTLPAGRAGVAILANLGLAELVATDRRGYLDIASALAQDMPRIAALRSGLRDRLSNSPLTDCGRFVRDLEAAYRAAWQTWCNRTPR